MTTSNRASLAAFIAVALACVVAFHIPLNYSPHPPVPHLPRPGWHLIAGAQLLPSPVLVAGSSLARAVKQDVKEPSEQPVAPVSAPVSAAGARSGVVEAVAIEAPVGGTGATSTTTQHQQAHTSPPPKPPPKHPHTKNPHTKNPPAPPVTTPPVTSPPPPTGTGTGGAGGTGSGGGDGYGNGYGNGYPSVVHPATYPTVYPGPDSGYYSSHNYGHYYGHPSSAYAARTRFGSWAMHGSTDRSRASQSWYDAADGHHAGINLRHGCDRGTGDGARAAGRHARH